MSYASEVVGIILEVYDDLGPTTRVTLDLGKCGRAMFDVGDLPVDEDWLRERVGCTIRYDSR